MSLWGTIVSRINRETSQKGNISIERQLNGVKCRPDVRCQNSL